MGGIIAADVFSGEGIQRRAKRGFHPKKDAILHLLRLGSIKGQFAQAGMNVKG
jgi:hypothetical protein